MAAQIAHLVQAELEKATAEASLVRTGARVPKAAALPRASPPEVLEIQDESSDEEVRARMHMAKAKRHDKAKQVGREWFGMLDTRGQPGWDDFGIRMETDQVFP